MRPARTILVVEDNPADIKTIERILGESTVPVELVMLHDGQDAVEYLLRQGPHAANGRWRRPDLVLLDLNLPRLTGQQVLERIRATPGLRALPVVVLTSSRQLEEVQEVYAAGANTYIDKPQEFHRFLEVLRAIRHYWLETALLPPAP